MKVSAILAVSENGVIGSDNSLPWRLSNDLQWFKKHTLNKPMIMGRKTFASLPGTLKGRTSIILSRDASFTASGALVADSKESALKLAREDAAQRSAEEIMIIGGGEIYKLFCGDIERYYITFVHTEMVGDTYFDPLPGEAWKVIFEEAHTASERNDYPHTFRILERNSAP